MYHDLSPPPPLPRPPPYRISALEEGKRVRRGILSFMETMAAITITLATLTGTRGGGDCFIYFLGGSGTKAFAIETGGNTEMCTTCSSCGSGEGGLLEERERDREYKTVSLDRR